MKRIIPLLLALTLLTGCGTADLPETAPTATEEAPAAATLLSPDDTPLPYISRFDSETAIILSDDGITVDGGEETDAVYTSHDIVYYEDRDTYESGNPYGAGDAQDKHTAEEAQAHTVVNITAPGAYRVTGKLSAGQIRIDLGEDAEDDPSAVVELILDHADITCTVAPAILFRHTYECDGDWSTDTASANVDTSDAGSVLVLSGENTVSGSYVAKVYKDKEGEKKLVKQDGAIYSYTSMNVEGDGSLLLTAENEGLDSELHLTINGGYITIHAQNDGINTNEDGVSVTTVNAGCLNIRSGLGEEGDGIDSNGFLVINGGTVISDANPISDSGLDSDLGTYINGGTVIALGSSMDGAEASSGQETLTLQFSQSISGLLTVTRQDGTVVFAYDLGDAARRYQGVILSSPNFRQGESYALFQGGTLTGQSENGLYDPTTVTAFDGGSQLQYTGTQAGFGHGGMGRPGGQMPQGEMPEPPEGFDGEMPTMPEGEMPDDFPGGEMPDGEMPDLPQGEAPDMPDGQRPEKPEGDPGDRDPQGEAPELPEGETWPADFDPNAEQQSGSTTFTLTEIVSTFAGLSAAQ